MNHEFANLLRRHLNDTFKTPESAATEWGLQPETVRKLLTGALLPSGAKHVTFFARKFGIPQDRVQRAVVGLAAEVPDYNDFFKQLMGHK